MYWPRDQTVRPESRIEVSSREYASSIIGVRFPSPIISSSKAMASLISQAEHNIMSSTLSLCHDSLFCLCGSDQSVSQCHTPLHTSNRSVKRSQVQCFRQYFWKRRLVATFNLLRLKCVNSEIKVFSIGSEKSNFFWYFKKLKMSPMPAHHLLFPQDRDYRKLQNRYLSIMFFTWLFGVGWV